MRTEAGGGARFVPLLIAIVVLTCLIALPMLTYPLGRDQGEFAVIGRGLLQGKVPYVDLWNPKPPAIFFVYAAAMSLFGQTAPALRAIDLLVMPFLLASVGWIGRRLFSPRIGLWAALLFAVFYFSETFWTLTQNDGIAVLPMCLALIAALKAAERSPRVFAWSLASGALMGVVVWFKYPFALFALVLLLAYGQRLPRQETRALRSWAVFALPAALGGLIAIGAGIAWLVSAGAWEAFVESARVTASYTALGAQPDALAEAAATALGFRWSHWGLLFILAAVGVLSIRRRAGVPFTFAWLLIAFAIMLVQLRGYDYHWLPMLPPLVLLGACGLTRALDLVASRLSPLAAPRWLSLAVALALIAILVNGIYPQTWRYLTGAEDRLTYEDRFVAGEFVAGESARVADYLRERNTPGDSLYVWGFRPEIYYLSGLNPPTRFIFQFPLVADWYPPEWREDNVDLLWAALPPYVLVLQVDYMPWVTGSEDDSNTLLQSYTDLNDWLIYNYERETQIGNFFIWRRKLQPG
ncbi:MAG: glycosyltransferase family 39 protein [Anaerolineae bacterium]|nr:glycosyltransferase family 39 protein [Anaerolineae bacterium]